MCVAELLSPEAMSGQAPDAPGLAADGSLGLWDLCRVLRQILVVGVYLRRQTQGLVATEPTTLARTADVAEVEVEAAARRPWWVLRVWCWCCASAMVGARRRR